MVWASDGEFGSGGTLGARLIDDWLPWDCVSEDGSWPADGVGLFWGPGDLFAPPRKRALLEGNCCQHHIKNLRSSESDAVVIGSDNPSSAERRYTAALLHHHLVSGRPLEAARVVCPAVSLGMVQMAQITARRASAEPT